MKEFIYNSYYRGIHLQLRVVCKTAKIAAEKYGISQYMIRTWCNVIPPKTKLAIDNPGEIIAEFERSGEAGYFIPKNKIGKSMFYDEAIAIIDEHRKIFKTYGQTYDYFNKE